VAGCTAHSVSPTGSARRRAAYRSAFASISSWKPEQHEDKVGADPGFGLSGQAAASVMVLFDHPPRVESVTVLGVALLVVTVLGFIRSLQRTYLAAWELPPQGIRGLGHGLLASAALIGEFALFTLLGPVRAVLVDSLAIRLTVQALAATVLWLPVVYLLLGGRVGFRALLPGAALTGAGQSVAIVVAGLHLSIAIGHEADRYGLFGIAIALLSWLVVLGLLLVVSAVLSAELTRNPYDTRSMRRRPG